MSADTAVIELSWDDRGGAGALRWAAVNPVRIGAVLLLVQPVYILVEVLAAVRIRTPYDLVSGTISDLGVLGCGPEPPYPGALGPVCSPAGTWLNTAFVLFGVAMMAGVLLARRPLGPGPVATALWVISGASSVATGFAPVDVAPVAHLLVSTPVFLAQPVALVLSGRTLHDRSAIILGALSTVAGVVLVLGLAGGADGLLERIALWPGFLWLGWAGLRLVREQARA